VTCSCLEHRNMQSSTNKIPSCPSQMSTIGVLFVRCQEQPVEERKTKSPPFPDECIDPSPIFGPQTVLSTLHSRGRFSTIRLALPFLEPNALKQWFLLFLCILRFVLPQLLFDDLRQCSCTLICLAGTDAWLTGLEPTSRVAAGVTPTLLLSMTTKYKRAVATVSRATDVCSVGTPLTFLSCPIPPRFSCGLPISSLSRVHLLCFLLKSCVTVVAIGSSCGTAVGESVIRFAFALVRTLSTPTAALIILPAGACFVARPAPFVAVGRRGYRSWPLVVGWHVT
jgi:hypothetical protein